MSKTACQTVLLALTLLLLLPTVATAQAEKTTNTPNPAAQNQKAAKTPKKLPLEALTLVSTSEAARGAAAEISAKKMALKDATRTSGKTGTKQKADGGVQQFQIDNAAGLADSSNGTFRIKDHKRSLLKNIHGSIYGATASGVGRANSVDGDVGADSSNGKLSVYVGGEHTHVRPATPH